MIFNWKFEFKESAYFINNQSVIKKKHLSCGSISTNKHIEVGGLFLKNWTNSDQTLNNSTRRIFIYIILTKNLVSFFVSPVSFDELLWKYKMSKCP